ncbi:plasmid partitioning protein RepB [Rhizobium sp. SL86]|uniref:plasmid partitioning protein RepB n=1 Tax=Rhizobium sp. SL86 TaxID=2995148 RepID=UPI002272F628|nr:plasmid partitioning protein RepB [Rhizobium sp. SL86]MCY1667394.1 plasmid partitioning protein RepB [Rhizobium sp. SL86]
MARKNLLSNLITDKEPTSVGNDDQKRQEVLRPATRGIGALGAVTRSIDELAARADAAREMEQRLASGDTVVDLDTELIDSSFIQDRVEMDEDKLRELVEAIKIRGQDSPILVRPHPSKHGHFQTVFGHRRLRAARELGIPVKAVVKTLEDRDHVIAQGQENSQRSDLSFIERAMFARNLEATGFARDTVMLALGADKTTVSKMLSAIERFPADLLNTVKAARAPGRDRWYALGAALATEELADKARSVIRQDGFLAATPEERFELLERLLSGKPPANHTDKSEEKTWVSNGKAVRASIKEVGRRVTISLKSPKDSDKATAFGAYLTQNLDKLFEAFEQDQRKTGD